MKKFTKSALATACIFGAGYANAGTEACFEVFKAADNAALTELILDTTYDLAACSADRTAGAAGSAQLQALNPGLVAYELTGDLDIDFDDVDATGGGAGDDLEIVYIPTTDIPSGTLITMSLSGATFDNNGDILHLVQQDVLGEGAGNTESFSAVASSDGAVDGESTITFLTKAGITITAGTRLVLSQVASGADDDALGQVGINITNTGCTDPTSSQSVTITADSAVTDGGTGFSIAGAASSATEVVQINPQFRTFYGSSSVEGEVNAESTRDDGTGIIARTEFVFDATGGSDDLIHQATQVISLAGFADYINEYDQAITIDADDHLETRFITSADPSSVVFAGIYNSQNLTTGVLANQVAVETGTTFGDIAQTAGDATLYLTEATEVFTEVNDDTLGNANTLDEEAVPAALTGLTKFNKLWYVLENTESPLATAMNFNYTHTPEYTLNFGTANELDHCTTTKELHDIGVNGAVLKVPYTFDTSNNWVRITNEHTESAEITLDVFDESGNQITSVDAGTVGQHASVVLRADALLDLAVAEGYAGVGSRHTMTFTVTAPKDSVHGVSVQAIPGGVDRVMPVLDQNVWTQ